MKDKEELLKEYEQEKKYISELQNTQSIEEKQRVISDYKKFLETQQEENIIVLKKQQEDSRKGKPIDNIEEHALVQSGVLTREEMAPIISAYELLNTLAAYNAGTEKIKELFNAARNFYSDDSAKGLRELVEIDHSKTSSLLGNNILELLQNKVITFTDIKSIKNNKLDKINTLDYALVKGLVELGCSIQELVDIRIELFVDNVHKVKNLVESGLSIQELLDKKADQQRFFIENSYQVKSLVKSGLTMQELLDMRIDQQKWFIENGFQVESLVKSILTMQELLDTETDQQKLFVENGDKVKRLVESGLSMQELLSTGTEQQKLVIENGFQVERLFRVFPIKCVNFFKGLYSIFKFY